MCKRWFLAHCWVWFWPIRHNLVPMNPQTRPRRQSFLIFMQKIRDFLYYLLAVDIIATQCITWCKWPWREKLYESVSKIFHLLRIIVPLPPTRLSAVKNSLIKIISFDNFIVAWIYWYFIYRGYNKYLMIILSENCNRMRVDRLGSFDHVILIIFIKYFLEKM